jgi:hypothetical protein
LPTYTMSSIRQASSDLVNDLYTGTGTFSTDRVVDSALLADEYKGKFYEVIGASATVRGVVTESGVGYITLSNSTGLVEGEAVTYELHELNCNSYDRMITLAFDEVREYACSDKVTTAVYSTGGIVCASDLNYIYKVEVDMGTGYVPVSHAIWKVLPGDRKFLFDSNYESAFDNKTCRFWGYSSPSNTSSGITIPNETFLVYRTAMLMLPSRPNWLEAADRGKMAQTWGAISEQKKSNLMVRVQPNTKRVG